MVLPECGEQTLERHGIVRVIDHQCEIVRHLHHLDPALHLRAQERIPDVLLLHAEMPADRDCRQRIVSVELPRNIRLYLHLQQTGHLEVDPQKTCTRHKF